MWGSGNDVLFIGQPSRTVRQLLTKLANKAGIPEFRYTDFCKTIVPSGRALLEEEAKHFFKHIKDEIAYVRPKLIILLGQVPSEQFGLDIGQSSQVEFMISDTKATVTDSFTVPVVSLPHPDSVLYKRISESDYIKHLQKAYELRKRQPESMDEQGE